MVRVGDYAVMLLGPRGARASLFCVAALGIITLSVLSAALAAHLKGTSLNGADPRFIRAALNPNEVPDGKDPPSFLPLQSDAVVNTLTVAKGDTLMDLLMTAGSDGPGAEAVIQALRKSFDPRKLRVGQELTIVLEAPDESEAASNLSAVSLELGDNAYVVVRRDGQGFSATRTEAPAVPKRAVAAIATGPRTVLTVRKDDTLNKLLQRAGANPVDAEAAAVAIGRNYDPRQLRIGQQLTTVFDSSAGVGTDAGASAVQGRLSTASLTRDDGSYAVAARSVDGGFRAGTARQPLVPLFAAPAATATDGPPGAVPDVESAPDVESTSVPPRDVPHDAPRRPTTISEGPVQHAAIPRDERPEQPAATEQQPAAAEQQIEQTTTLRDETPRQTVVAIEQPVASTAARQPAQNDAVFKTVHARKGDTLTRLMLRAGSDRRDAYAAITALSDYYDPRRLQPGQELVVAFAGGSGGGTNLAAVSVAVGKDSYVVAGRDEDGRFTASRGNEPLSVTMDIALLAAVAPPEIVFAPEPKGALRKNLRLNSGDTLMDTLLRAGSGRRDAHAAIAALRKRADPRKLKAGQLLTLVFAPDHGDGPVLHSLALAVEPGRSVVASRAEANGFAVRDVEVPLDRVLVHAGSRIDSSLYRAASKAGVPLTVMMEMIRAFSFDVDFQREIQSGDSFSVLFERYADESGEVVREGNLLHASITLGNTTLKVYRYPLGDDYFDYFSDDGQSVRKALLRTPVNGARLSSGYGKRKHPILGYTKMHRGLDFAARSGTPIVAAGNGVIERIGRNGAYGNYIRIRHKGQYATAYAHMKGFAKGLRKGGRIRQGDVIGYVGSTGRSTGPHLHYEVLAGGRQINPLKIKLPTGPKLKGDELAAFRRTRDKIEKQLAALPLVRHVADNRLSSLACGGSLQEMIRASRSASPVQSRQC